MTNPRRLLLLEDDPNDVELFGRRLLTEWPDLELVRVSTEAGFKAALNAGGFDIIISDYRLPDFHGLAALALAREQCPGVPLLFLSGVLGDDVAVESLKAGATDYVLKDRPARLVPAIRRALAEAGAAARRKETDEKMTRIQAKLKQANKDLVRRNREIQSFYHTLSHELKTPLTSAREFISIVLDGIAGPLSATQSEYLGIAKDSCNQLRICINDLLDATRLETGKLALDLKPCSLATLLQKAVLTISRSAADKNLSLVQDVQPNLPELPVDEFRITQVIINLLNNAIKFTPPFGRIKIKAGEVPNQPDLVQVSVSDTGCGIPAEEQEHIFDRLYQVKAGDATTEQGVGLGLYLCRELVHLHGGSISVESAPREGSTFSFVIPRSREYLQSNLLPNETETAVWQRDRFGLQAHPVN
jgi:two-component system sensor histidine kinase EvgS